MPMFMMHLLVRIENIVRQYNTILLQNRNTLAALQIGSFLQVGFSATVKPNYNRKKPPGYW
jgi:hypothetical protein